jgi:hypothetical protein
MPARDIHSLADDLEDRAPAGLVDGVHHALADTQRPAVCAPTHATLSRESGASVS